VIVVKFKLAAGVTQSMTAVLKTISTATTPQASAYSLAKFVVLAGSAVFGVGS